ncbi:MAG: hypothetical protein KDE15_10370 [Erythrobacter sp.]|nr:hypothetical protein [Erythrobacter sp.]
MKRLWLGLLALLLVAPQPALAQARNLEPAGDWSLRQDSEYCRLSRTFGSGSRQVALYLYSYGPTGGYQVILVGQGLPRNENKARVANIAWGSIADAEPSMVINGRVGNQGSITFRTYPAQAGGRFTWIWSGTSDNRTEVPFNPLAQRLAISTGELDPIELPIGDMAQPLAQLANCEAALAASWYLSVADPATLTSQPELLNGYEVLRSLRWPATLLLNRQSLLFQMRMAVDAQGQVQDCVLQAPLIDQQDARLLCRDFTRVARFTPATGQDGQPVAALFRASTLLFLFD